VAMISILRDRPLGADAEQYERVSVSTEDEGILFVRWLLVSLALSVSFYAGLGSMIWSLLI
jgi:hypothetical protein